MYINGVLIGNDLAKALLANNTNIVSNTFIGISSTSNVANIFVDDVVVYNSVPAIIGSYVSASSGDWNTASTWAGEGVPPSGATEIINHAVIISGSLTNTGTITVNSDGSLIISNATLTNNGTTNINGTFQINEGGWATGSNFVYGSAGTLIFNNSSGSYGVNNDAFLPSSNSPVNITVAGAGGITMNVARTVTGTFQTAAGVTNANNLTLNGTAQLNTGGYFTGSPTYGSSSTLVYNTGGTYGVSNEWGSGTSGAGVPKNLTIQNSTTVNMPTTDRTATGNINISSGVLALNGSSGDLYVGGNWSNSGTFTPNNRAVFFNGTGDQTIGASTFDWLLIDKDSGTASISGNVIINNTLTVSNGTLSLPAAYYISTASLTNGGTVNVLSDASNSGSLIISGTYSGAGTFTYQRYMPDANYHMLGSPFSGQTINSFLTNGANSIVLIGSDYSMKNYNEGTDVWSSLYTTGTGGNIVLGQGYATKRSASGTVDLTGTPNTAAISDIALTRTSFGWNLLSNPFTSAIAANAQGDPTNNLISINSSGVLDPNYTALYIWDGTAYKIINHASGSPTASLEQNYLQVGQGFFVKSKLGGGTFSITPAMQSHQTGIAFKSNPIQFAGIVLNAEKNTSKISTQISYKEGMNRGLDIGYDAGLMKSNPSFALYSRLVEDNGVDFGIQCLPAEYDDLVVPIGLDAKSGDIIKFTAQSFNLPEEYNVYLEDRVLGIYTNLSPVDASYNTQLLSDSKGTGRFFVRTSMESALGIGNLDNGNPFKVFTRSNHNQIVIHGEANANTIARIYSISGKQIISYSLKQGTENLVQFNEEAGVYIVKISNEQGTYTQKFGWLK